MTTRTAHMPPHAGSLSVVIPVLNEVEALPGVLAEVPWEDLLEVIVVDGGSVDGTPEAARAAGARVVTEPRPGYGRACATGAREARGALIAFMDGDGSDDPADLARVVAPVREGTAALALGRRVAAEPGAVRAHQGLGNRLVSTLIRARFRLAVHDIPSLRVVRADVLAALPMREMGYGWPTEMVVRVARARLPVAQVPVRARARRGGRSKVAGRLVPSVRAGVRMLVVAGRAAR